jgi:hypothetical protein
MDEKFISWKTGFDLSDGSSISEDVISLSTNFNLTLDGEKYARSHEHYISIGSKIDVYDENDVLLGTVEEKLFNSFFSFYSSYNIYDANHKQIAKSVKHEFMTSEFIITDMADKEICVITQDHFTLTDTWNFNFKQDKYDKRLFVFIPCYKTKRNNIRQEEEDNE